MAGEHGWRFRRFLPVFWLVLVMAGGLEGVAAGQSTAPAATRPQTPMPPFPYRQIDVQFQNEKDGNTIAGTLTVPDGAGPFPAVVLITGSGAQDRDETVARHKPFWVIADHLSRHGIAVLRTDDRGVGKSTGSIPDSTTEDFAGDALAGVRALGGNDLIDRSRIGLMGHSEGATVAAIGASTSKEVAFIVLLAGCGVPGRELLPAQMRGLLRAGGTKQESIEAQIAIQASIMAIVERDAPPLPPPPAEELAEIMKKLVRQQSGLAGMLMSDAAAARAVAPQVAQLRSRWYRRFLQLDPRDYLRQVRCPVLAINGEKDLQVPPDQNLPEIDKALREGGNTDVTIVRIPNLNHLFQTAKTGLPSEYMQNRESFSPAALEVITPWIRRQAGIQR